MFCGVGQPKSRCGGTVLTAAWHCDDDDDNSIANDPFGTQGSILSNICLPELPGSEKKVALKGSGEPRLCRRRKATGMHSSNQAWRNPDENA
jgi:hypothetical protein